MQRKTEGEGEAEGEAGLLKPKDDRPILRRGSSGPDVVQLQSDLNQVGAQPPLAEDGIFGKLTRQAVVTFQTSRAIMVDGIVGPQTWGALDNAKAGAPPDDSERKLERLDRLDDLFDDWGDHIIPGIGPFFGDLPDGFRPPPTGKKPPSSKDGDQNESLVLPHHTDKLIGQIHFATNNTELTDDDIRGLDRLAEAIEAYGDSLISDPYVIEFHGFADPRATSYPGGNHQLGLDRAQACHDYFKKKLSKKAALSVKPSYLGKGARPDLAIALGVQLAKGGDTKTIDRQLRTVAIVAPKPLVPLKPCPPPADRAAALAQCRKVLGARKDKFSPQQHRRLTHIVEDATTRDGFLNGMDPDLVNIAYGLRGPVWTQADAEAFANRHKAFHFLEACYVSGPNAEERDTVAGLKLVHDLIDQGLDHLKEGTGKDTFSGAANSRRVELNKWVKQEQKDQKSVYHNW